MICKNNNSSSITPPGHRAQHPQLQWGRGCSLGHIPALDPSPEHTLSPSPALHLGNSGVNSSHHKGKSFKEIPCPVQPPLLVWEGHRGPAGTQPFLGAKVICILISHLLGFFFGKKTNYSKEKKVRVKVKTLGQTHGEPVICPALKEH